MPKVLQVLKKMLWFCVRPVVDSVAPRLSLSPRQEGETFEEFRCRKAVAAEQQYPRRRLRSVMTEVLGRRW